MFVVNDIVILCAEPELSLHLLHSSSISRDLDLNDRKIALIKNRRSETSAHIHDPLDSTAHTAHSAVQQGQEAISGLGILSYFVTLIFF